MGMLFFCELYVIRDELALLGRTAHHPRSWASTSYNYNCLPATSRMVAWRLALKHPQLRFWLHSHPIEVLRIAALIWRNWLWPPFHWIEQLTAGVWPRGA